MKQTQQATAGTLGTYLKAGLIAGIVAAILANLEYFIYQQVTGNSFAELNVISITAASIAPALVGAIVYYGLRRFTSRAKLIFIGGGALFTLLSIIPSIAQPLYPGFTGASAPLHIIVGATVLGLLPMLVERNSR